MQHLDSLMGIFRPAKVNTVHKSTPTHPLNPPGSLSMLLNASFFKHSLSLNGGFGRFLAVFNLLPANRQTEFVSGRWVLGLVRSKGCIWWREYSGWRQLVCNYGSELKMARTACPRGFSKPPSDFLCVLLPALLLTLTVLLFHSLSSISFLVAHFFLFASILLFYAFILCVHKLYLCACGYVCKRHYTVWVLFRRQWGINSSPALISAFTHCSFLDLLYILNISCCANLSSQHVLGMCMCIFLTLKLWISQSLTSSVCDMKVLAVICLALLTFHVDLYLKKKKERRQGKGSH